MDAIAERGVRGADRLAGRRHRGRRGRRPRQRRGRDRRRRRADTRSPCDLLLVCGGWNPTAHLFSHVRGALATTRRWARSARARTLDGVTVVGAANGTLDLAGCLREGAGDRAAAGRPDAGAGRARPARSSGGSRARTTASSSTSSATPPSPTSPARSAPGCARPSTSSATRPSAPPTTRARPPACWPRRSPPSCSGAPIEDLGTTTFRPPYAPVAFAALAGRERGQLFDPVRIDRAAPLARRARARCSRTSASGSGRATTRGPGRTWRPRCCASARRSATGVGILDGSTLGKIDVQGADAAVLLDRVYTNMMSNLAVGKVRYGVMCGPDGMVIDDGTVCGWPRTGSSSSPPPAARRRSSTGWRSGCRPSGRSCGCTWPRSPSSGRRSRSSGRARATSSARSSPTSTSPTRPSRS